MVLVEKRGQGLLIAGLLAVLVLLAEEELAEGVEHDESHAEADEADGQEVEEAEARLAVVAEVAVDNEVRGRTDEGQDTTHGAREGQGHHQLARTRAGRLRHGEDDGQEQGHRTRVAHEGSHYGGHDHHEEEELHLARACQFQQAARNNLGQTCLEHGPADDEQTNHHHHRRVGEAGEGLARCEHIGHQEQRHGAERNDVGAHFVGDERHDSKGKDGENDTDLPCRRGQGLSHLSNEIHDVVRELVAQK